MKTQTQKNVRDNDSRAVDTLELRAILAKLERAKYIDRKRQEFKTKHRTNDYDETI